MHQIFCFDKYSIYNDRLDALNTNRKKYKSEWKMHEKNSRHCGITIFVFQITLKINNWKFVRLTISFLGNKIY